MNAQQRGPYNKMAKDNDIASQVEVERLNCHGKPLSSVAREEKEAAERELNMKRATERIVRTGRERHGEFIWS